MRYARAVEGLEPLHLQGDGVRSFVGVLLEATVAEWSVVLLDEPEAFLHPPQARLLGEELASAHRASSQTLIATHSSDFLKGILDADKSNVRVLRLTRHQAGNRVHELSADAVRQVWKDPLLRYSNVLDGLFHDAVVLCESDADCLLYEAATASLLKDDPRLKRPDLHFIHSGGKDRMPVVIRALKKLGVPIFTVPDFDVLNSEEPLKSIIEGHGGDWKSIQSLWKTVNQSIGPKGPELTTTLLRVEIGEILKATNDENFPEAAADKIRRLLRRATPWSQAKKLGVDFLSGSAHRDALMLLNRLSDLGIFVVPVGELESFFRSVDGHGPSFAAQVLETDLFSQPESLRVKKFMQQVIFGRSSPSGTKS